MNTTQKNFKKQMLRAEKNEHKLAKKNKGIFSNKLFELRFYGYNGNYKKPTNPIIKAILILFKIIKWVIITTITILILILILFIIIDIQRKAA